MSRDKQGFHECGMGGVGLVLLTGSKKRGAHSGGLLPLNLTTTVRRGPLKYETLQRGFQIKQFVQK